MICMWKKKEYWLNKQRLYRIKKYVRFYSFQKKYSKTKKNWGVNTRENIIALSALNYEQCNGVKINNNEELYLNALTKLMAFEIDCHAIYKRKEDGFLKEQNNFEQLFEYIDQNDIKIIVDFHIVNGKDDCIFFLKKSSNYFDSKYDWINELFQYSFEFKYKDDSIANVVKNIYCEKKDIVEKIAEKKEIAYISVGINKKYLDYKHRAEFIKLYNTLYQTINMLKYIDWSAKQIKVYRLWQAAIHKPQDKVELIDRYSFENGSLLNVCTYGMKIEKVRLHQTIDNKTAEFKKNISNEEKNTYAFLTNRLIEILFEREWIEGNEYKSGIMGAPIIIYENIKETYPIGLPKASQIDGIYFSSQLYADKKEEAKKFDYVIFNRYTDSRLHVEYEKMDYADFGRVKNDDGNPAKKIMIPRYYKRLLGYLDYPLRMIREEEYNNILKKIESNEEKNLLKKSYEKINGEIFYKIKDSCMVDEKDSLKKVIEIEKKLGLYNEIEILKTPKLKIEKRSIVKKLKYKWDKIRINLLKKVIGKSEYLLKAEWTSETDDRNNIARLSDDMMSLLGVSENDKILVKFGKQQVVLRVLEDDNLTNYQIGIPASARKRLNMNSVNDIVVVHRDMVHIFWRHSEEQTIAILGTVLAVFQVTNIIWLDVLLCIIITPLIMYFVLNEERVKVK